MIVIMGVSGCGKTTIGKLLADKLRLDFYDADDFHPEANIKKMKKAIPLTDKDRIPWLERLANEMMIWEKSGGGILSCSALKEDYRQILSSQIQHIDWIYLSGTFDLINSRLKNRQGHYMRTELLKSQFDVLEVPHNSIKVDIKNSPEEIVNILLSKVKHRLNSGFGVIGLGVMGKSIALNVADKGYNVSVYNRTEEGESEFVKDFLVSNADKKNLFGFTDLNKFVKSIERPRKILLMVKAGKIVDIVIENLLPFLDKDDIVIDGGNSHFLDTKRRSEQLVKNNIQFIGAGISGGEEGARYGPSIMPGGSEKSYKIVAPILEAISAKDVFGKSCCTYIGPEGAGHFIKMVHNGMEYAEMQLLAELFALMSKTMSFEQISRIFTTWNKGDMSSYLLEITIKILQKKEGDQYLLDLILDKAANKGTGSWSSKVAFDLGVPGTMMSSAVFARYLSSFKEKRNALSAKLSKSRSSKNSINIEALEKAYRFARIINHHQGFDLMNQASKVYKWKLSLDEIARIWTNGCIIKSNFMTDSVPVLKEHGELLKDDYLFELLNENEEKIKEILYYSLENRIAVPCFYSAYDYWISLTTKKLPANLIQAQRDFFGAHTYQRTDSSLDKHFHSSWI